MPVAAWPKPADSGDRDLRGRPRRCRPISWLLWEKSPVGTDRPRGRLVLYNAVSNFPPGIRSSASRLLARSPALCREGPGTGRVARCQGKATLEGVPSRGVSKYPSRWRSAGRTRAIRLVTNSRSDASFVASDGRVSRCARDERATDSPRGRGDRGARTSLEAYRLVTTIVRTNDRRDTRKPIPSYSSPGL